MIHLYENNMFAQSFNSFDELFEHFAEMLGRRLGPKERFQLKKGLSVQFWGTWYNCIVEDTADEMAEVEAVRLAA